MNEHISILVVDDEPHLLAATEQLLRNAGYQVMTAATGGECLHRAQTQPPDLVLLDRVLPDGDGMDICRRLKADPTTGGAFVVLISGLRISPDDQADGLETGADGYITRPIENRQLLAQVAAMVRIKQVEEQSVRLRRVLRAVNNVNQLLVREKDRDRMLQGACDLLVETRGYRNVWVAMLSQAGELETSFGAGLDATADPLPPQLGRGELPLCAQRALAQEAVQMTHSLAIDCAERPMVADADGWAGLTSRLAHAGTVYGVLCASVPAHSASNEEEIELFHEVAGGISLALHDVDLQDQHARALRALRQSEAKLKGLFENSPDIVALVDLDGTVLDINRVAPGYRKEDVIGSGFTDYLTAEQTQMFADALKVTLETGVSQGYEAAITDPQGQTTVWFNRLSSVEGDQGVVQFVVNCTDVTERKRVEGELRELLKQAEQSRRALLSVLEDRGEAESQREAALEAVRHSEVRYRTLFEGMPIGLYRTTPDARILEINPALSAMLGNTGHEGTSTETATEAYVDPTERARWQALMDRDGMVSGFEAEWRRRDETTMWTRDTARAVVDAQGQTLYYDGAVENITERKLAEAKLRESEEKYRLLFDTMLDGLALHEMLYDDEGAPYDYRFVEVNVAFERMTGLTAEDVVGKTVLEVLPETEARWIEAYGDVAESGESGRFEDYRSALGKYFEVIAFSPRPHQFATIFSDITERKEAEALIQQLNADLEARIEQRTAELAQASERLELATRSARVGIWDWDVKRDVLTWDDTVCGLFGITRDDFQGNHAAFLQRLHPEDAGRVDRQIAAALGGGEHYAGEFRIVSPDDTLRCLRAVASVTYAPDGGAERMIGVNWDITESKRAELELRQFNDVMVGREARIIELKEEVNRLATALGQDVVYPPVWETGKEAIS